MIKALAYALFWLVILPFGVVLRLFSRQPFGLHRHRAGATYWRHRQPLAPASKRYRSQL